jgi:hypothetical protein
MSWDGPGGPIAPTQPHHDRHVGRPHRPRRALRSAVDVGRHRDDDACGECRHGGDVDDEHHGRARVLDHLNLVDHGCPDDNNEHPVDHRRVDHDHHDRAGHHNHARSDDDDLDDRRADDLDDELATPTPPEARLREISR